MLDSHFCEKILPKIQSKPPSTQVKVISSCLITYMREEVSSHLAPNLLSAGVVESKKLFKPLFLQAEPRQLPQPFLGTEMLQAPHLSPFAGPTPGAANPKIPLQRTDPPTATSAFVGCHTKIALSQAGKWENSHRIPGKKRQENNFCPVRPQDLHLKIQ